MANYKSMFLQYMDSKDIKYTELDEFGVGIVVGGENIDAIRVLVIFEEDGSPALQLRSLSFIDFRGKEIRAITACNKIKVSSIALICFSAASIITVFVGLNFIGGEDNKIIYIAAVGAFYSTIRVLTFLPLYGAKCLGFKRSTFYPVILRNVLSVAVLVAIAVGINAVFDINSWFKLVCACIVIGIIGLVANMFALFNKSERHEFLSMIKRFAGKKGE